jgi:hypothetical protein
MLQFGASLTGDTSIVIYDCIVYDTGQLVGTPVLLDLGCGPTNPRFPTLVGKIVPAPGSYMYCQLVDEVPEIVYSIGLHFIMSGECRHRLVLTTLSVYGCKIQTFT